MGFALQPPEEGQEPFLEPVNVCDLYTEEVLTDDSEELDSSLIWPDDVVINLEPLSDADGWNVHYSFSKENEINFKRNDLDSIHEVIENNPGLSFWSIIRRWEQLVEDENFDVLVCHKVIFKKFKAAFFDFLVSLDRVNLTKEMFGPYFFCNIYYLRNEPDYIRNIYKTVGVYMINGKIKFGCYRENTLNILKQERAFAGFIKIRQRKNKHRAERTRTFTGM